MFSSPSVRRRTRSATAALAAGVLTATTLVLLPGSAEAAASTLGAAAAQSGRYFGAAISASHLGEQAYVNTWGAEFNSVTPENEMKWDTVEPNRNQFNFAPADRIVSQARSRGMSVRGHTFVWHSGGVSGQTSIVVLIPSRNAGFAVLTNAEEGMVVRTLMNTLLDHYLGLPKIDWLADSKKMQAGMEAEMAKSPAVQATRPADAGPPSLPLTRYAGLYRDAWYGDIVIAHTPAGLTIDFTRTPLLKGTLEPWSHDTFKTKFTDRSQEDAFVTFALNPDGSIDQAKLQAVSPIADFSYDYQDLLLKPVAKP